MTVWLGEPFTFNFFYLNVNQCQHWSGYRYVTLSSRM